MRRCFTFNHTGKKLISVVMAGPTRGASVVLLALAALAAATAAALPDPDAASTTMPPPPSPPPPPKKTNPVGYLEVLIASFFFGSNFVPVKRYETYDGMYYQWVMCCAIFMFGLSLQLLIFAAPGIVGDTDGSRESTASNQTCDERVLSGRPDPYSVKFIPMACLGGVLWATGNTLSVPVINMIGLSLGLLVWGSANMLTGWAISFFGLFGSEKDDLAEPGLNIAGVVLAVLALSMYTQIKTSEQTKPLNSEAGSDVHPLDDVLLETVRCRCAHDGPAHPPETTRLCERRSHM